MVYVPISTTDLPTILCARALLTIHILHAPLTWATFQVAKVSVKLLNHVLTTEIKAVTYLQARYLIPNLDNHRVNNATIFLR